MKRYLFGLLFIIMSLTASVSLFAQVKLLDSGVTKFYDNGTRITYFEMADFPNSPEMREYVSKVVLENPDINRVVMYRNGQTFMYEALQSVEPDMIVDVVNDALAEYRASVGDFPPPSPQDYEKPKSNVVVTRHSNGVTEANLSASPEMRKSEEKKVAGQEKSSSDLKAVPATPQTARQQSDVDSKSVSPAKYNENNMNK